MHPAHAASFVGESFRISVVCNGVKLPLVTHTNAYVGHLRRQVRLRPEPPTSHSVKKPALECKSCLLHTCSVPVCEGVLDYKLVYTICVLIYVLLFNIYI